MYYRILLQNLKAMRMQVSYKRFKEDNYAVIPAKIYEKMLNVHVDQEPFVFLIKEERIIQEDLWGSTSLFSPKLIMEASQ
jgi:hypothetical protein